MANPNVKKQLERIGNELQALNHHVRLYGGISKADAMKIDTEATNLAETAASIAEQARAAYGSSERGLVTKVRKALGFTSARR